MRRKKNWFFGFFLGLIALAVLFLFLRRNSSFEIMADRSQTDREASAVSTNATSSLAFSPISGLACPDAQRRPLAVMLSGDAVARPLSGLTEADLVIDMEVVTAGITRLMAVYICGNPAEIGSVRSARDDYITLARGLDAIYVHWGGSHFSLDKLNAGVMDDIDALKNPYNAFWRKTSVEEPHNGFSSLSRLAEAVKKLGFRSDNNFTGYPHLTGGQVSKTQEFKTLTIGYAAGFVVKYNYDPTNNSYWRIREGKKEIDKNNGQQVVAKNVVVMRASSAQIEGQYNKVQVEGSGSATVYRNGEVIDANWKKDASDPTSKLLFYDKSNQEIKFVPGQIWIEIAEPNQTVSWE